MSGRCSVCKHEQIELIDNLLVSGVALRDIAHRFGFRDHTALHRHRENGHVPVSLVQLSERSEERRGKKLLDRIEELVTKIENLADAAEKDGKAAQLLQAADRLDKLYRLVGNMTGELDDKPATTVNVLVSSDWLQLRASLFAALDPYPEARGAVARQLIALEEAK